MPEIPNIVPDTVKTFETHWTNGLSDLEGTFYSRYSYLLRSDWLFLATLAAWLQGWYGQMLLSAMTFRTDINESKNKNPTDFAVFCKKTQ